MGWVIEQCRLTALEYPMSDDLEADAGDDQDSCYRPQDSGVRMAHDKSGRRKQRYRRAENGRTDGGVERQPISKHRQHHDRCQGRVHPQRLNWNKAERKNGRKEQCDDAENIIAQFRGSR